MEKTVRLSKLQMGLGLWTLFVLYYGVSLRFNFYPIASDFTLYLAQLLADLGLLTCSVLAYLKQENKQSKTFFGLLMISILLSVVSNEAYNLSVNMLGDFITPVIDAFWTLPYVLFLGIQITTWSYLLWINRSTELSGSKNWLLKLSYLQTIIVILLSIFIIIMFKNEFLKNMSGIQIFNSLLEAMIFILILMCLTRAKGKALSLLASGFLFAIAFNLAHRFSYVSGHYHKIFGAFWLMCPILLIVGFLSAQKKDSENGDFFERNSLHVLVSTCILSATFLSIFFVIGILLLSNEVGGFTQYPENLASVLVLAFSLSVLLSKLSASYFSSHLDRLVDRVNWIQENPIALDQLPRKDTQVHEIEKVDRFILETIHELQAANRVKSDFLMNMSHDFRTPASGIYQMSTAIYKRMPDNKLKELQKLIVDSSSQLMRLLDEVLTYSNLEGGKVNVSLAPFDVHEVIKELIQFVMPKIEEKGLMLETHFSKANLIYVGDRVLLHRVLLNLLSNAIKFTSQGKISIWVSEVQKGLQISIQDTGIGIAPEEHVRIFEAFYRVADSEVTSHAGFGIGLGLGNVSLMLEKMQGTLSLKSQLGEGATFTIVLPVNN